MADNQLKRIEPIDFGNDDPFAELTKIMGFDPRQPAARPVEPPKVEAARPAPVQVRAPEPVIPAPSVPEPELADDFSIDLEQELLAGFDAPFRDEPAAAAPLAVEPPVTYSRPAVSAPEPVAYAPAAPEPDLSIADDLDFDLEGDFAAALETEISAEPAYQAPQVAVRDEARRTAPAAAQPVYEELHDEDLIGDLELALGDEPPYAEPGQPYHAAGAAAPDYHPAEQAAAYESAEAANDEQSDMDFDFDLAMAEVDMEFEGDASATDFAPQAPAAYAPVEYPVEYDEPAQAWAPADDPAEDLDRVIGELDAAAHTPAFEAGSFDAVPAFGGEPPAAVEPEPEMDFEEELRALLGSPVKPAVLASTYEDEAPVAMAQTWNEPEVAYAPQLPADEPVAAPEWEPEVLAAELEDAFDDHAFDAAFERELAAEPAAPVIARAAAAPIVDTVEVPESAVAYTEELDIPELHREDAVPAAPHFDDFDTELATLYAEPAPMRRDPAPQPVSRAIDPFEAALATTAAATAAISGTARPAEREASAPAFEPVQRQQMNPPPQFDGFDDDLDQPLDFSDVESFEDEPAPKRRGLMIAAVVGGVALLGAVGAFALSFGDSTTDATVPALVKADPEPVKVRPDEPGGEKAPNADSKVFQTMAGQGGADAPAQEKLISSDEEPVDIAARDVEPLALGKSEERVTPSEEPASADSMEVAAVAPRRVKTMIVKPDGSLVAREEIAAPAVAEPETPAPTETVMTLPGVEAAPIEPVVPAAPEAVAAGTPAEAPVAPARPSDQPVEVVGEVAPERVALTTPAGGWAVQIASQPSEAAAKSTFDDLARRYASVIGGREASIVKAEIAGKGTFWRVRIGAPTRNEAISLCEQYKSAGGSCFVSK